MDRNCRAELATAAVETQAHRSARWLAFPVILGGSIALALQLSPAVGMPVAVLVAQTAALLVIVVCEHWLPFRADWNRVQGDLGTDILHALISGVAVTRLMHPLAQIAGAAVAGLLSTWIGSDLWPSSWSLPAQLALALIIAEFPQYWLHRWEHEIDPLWRLHATHHSAPRLYWLNAARFHPLDIGLLYFVGYVPLVVLGCSPDLLLLFALFDGVFGMLQHGNIDVRLGPLNYVFSMAEPHRWHHSLTLAEANTNYGSNLILWDLVFGTFFLPRDRRAPAGIGIHAMPSFPADYLGQILSPLRWKRLQRAAVSHRRAPV